MNEETESRILRKLKTPMTALELKRLLSEKDWRINQTKVDCWLTELTASGQVTYEDKPHRTLRGAKERWWRVKGL